MRTNTAVVAVFLMLASFVSADTEGTSTGMVFGQTSDER